MPYNSSFYRLLVHNCNSSFSYLKIKDVSQLPHEYLCKSKGWVNKGQPVQSRVPVTRDDSAATPPTYRYKTSQIISLTESVELQQHQQAKQEVCAQLTLLKFHSDVTATIFVSTWPTLSNSKSTSKLCDFIFARILFQIKIMVYLIPLLPRGDPGDLR